jgi:hypothetical protein
MLFAARPDTLPNCGCTADRQRTAHPAQKQGKAHDTPVPSLPYTLLVKWQDIWMADKHMCTSGNYEPGCCMGAQCLLL